MPYAALAAAAREKKEVCAVLVAQKSKVNWGAKKEAPDERRERVLVAGRVVLVGRGCRVYMLLLRIKIVVNKVLPLSVLYLFLVSWNNLDVEIVVSVTRHMGLICTNPLLGRWPRPAAAAAAAAAEARRVP